MAIASPSVPPGCQPVCRINTASGLISGTVTVPGTFNPVVRATDPGGLFATATFGWTVNSAPVNRNPTIVTPAAQSSALGAVISLSMSAADPDGDSLTYSATGLPSGLSIAAGSGVISGTTTVAGAFSTDGPEPPTQAACSLQLRSRGALPNREPGAFNHCTAITGPDGWRRRLDSGRSLRSRC